MSAADPLEQLSAHKREVLSWEFCCLLHDIGKLSEKFLTYRQTWHAEPDGYAHKDPHDHEWLTKDEILRNEFPELLKFFKSELTTAHVVPGTLSVENAVHEHIHPKDELCEILARGDRIDSQYDRNNPLLGCEQTRHTARADELRANPPPVYRSNVFGYEGYDTCVDPLQLETQRRIFYTRLSEALQRDPKLTWAHYADFEAIRNAMRECWRVAMSDTTRPNNDTSLWEHVYSVSSISKALHIKRLITGKFDKDPNKVFRIWGFGFDSLRYISFSHKLRDVIARRQVIERIFDKAVEIVEFDRPLGNHVYRDENCIFFLAADLGDEFFEALKARIVATTVGNSHGELLPHFEGPGLSTKTLTGLSGHIEALREHTKIPVRGDVSAILDRFNMAWKGGTGQAICPVCRLRPCSPDENSICEKCLERRRRAELDQEQTVFMSEIAAQNKSKSRRLALIVVRIGLHDWLNGKLVRTSFVTEPHGIEATLQALPKFVDLNRASVAWEVHDRLTKSSNFATMRAEFEKAARDPASESLAALFYGRGLGLIGSSSSLRVRPASEIARVLSDTGEEIKIEPGFHSPPSLRDLLTGICAKTPTPSTLLDVWHSTRNFMREVKDLLNGNPLPRASLTVSEDPTVTPKNKAIDEAKVDGVRREVVYREGKQFWVLNASQQDCEGWGNKTLELDAEHSYQIETAIMEPNKYLPWRQIAASPDLLMLLVPADQAIDLTQRIYDRFLERFGKAYGRLPIAIANIFFPDHLPMFSVLDAARRVERNFHALQKEVWVKTVPPLDLASLNRQLGDGTTDWFHPYIRACGPATDDDMETVMLTVRHFSHVRPSDEVLIQPNLYFAGWLGNSAARFEISARLGVRPEMTVEEWLKAASPMRGRRFFPMLLDRLKPKIIEAWKGLKDSDITDSRFRNALQIYRARLHSWPDEKGARDTAASLAAAILRHPVQAALKDESLERMTLLYLHILKQHLAEE